MRISVYAFVYACVLLVAVALAAPHVSEEFSATVKLSLHHKSIGHNITGHGLWASSLSGGRSIERFLFGPQGHPYNEFRLQRYDLATAYEEVHGSSCLVTPLEGVMAPVWGWLAHANETTTSSGKHYTLAMGYATVSLYLNEKGVPRLYIVDGPGRTATFEFLLWTDVTPGAGVFEVPKHCPATSPAPSGPSLVGCIGRSTIIGRAQDWVNRHVPYSQSGSYDGYRTDCSGYVSMAWEAARPGYSCSTLPQVSHPISRGQLQPGDVLLCRTEHVVIFGGWASSTHYVAFEETRPGEGTVRRVTPYPYWYNTGCFLPYRYNAVC